MGSNTVAPHADSIHNNDRPMVVVPVTDKQDLATSLSYTKESLQAWTDQNADAKEDLDRPSYDRHKLDEDIAWRDIAETVDRLVFFTFSSIIVVSTVVVLPYIASGGVYTADTESATVACSNVSLYQ